MTNPPAGGRAQRRRAAEEASRQRSEGIRRALSIGLAIVALVGVVGAGAWWVMHRSTPGPAVSPPAPTDPALLQPTLLFQVQAADRVAVNNALLAVKGPIGQGVMIQVPQSMIVDVATGGPLPFGETARLPDASASADALSDQMGVRIDGTFVLDRLAFAALVDAVGGVTVTVDVDVIGAKPDGTKTVLVPAGTAKLDGLSASAYANYLAPGEPEEARMARFNKVFASTIALLPPTAAQIEPIFTSLGSLARSTKPTADVAAFFAQLRAYFTANSVIYRNLPVKEIDAGGTEKIYRASLDEIAVLVNDLLPQAVRVPGPNAKVRVLVQNGRFVPGYGAAARDRLVAAGFTYVYGGNASALLKGPSQILIPDTTAASIAWGNDIAKALALPSADVVVDTEGQSVADVIVVLGTDFSAKASP